MTLDVFAEIVEEANRAECKYAGYTSTHEAYGVLAEQVAELLEAIRSNKLESVRCEAIQGSAVAARLASQCRDDGDFAARSVRLRGPKA